MPTLFELQRAMRACLVERESAAIVGSLVDGARQDRLDIYHNTIFSGLTKALRLAYPAVERLVGDEFFVGAAGAFITKNFPRAAYLDQYGGAFPNFLHDFPPAASVPYLADVARLEWAVNCALYAPDQEPLELVQLAEVAPEQRGAVSFGAHPSVGLLRADYPVDDIWRAVLNGDDQMLAALDAAAGQVSLLVERDKTGVQVVRLREPEWRFLAALCRGEPLHSAIGSVADNDASAALAEHFAAGRFIGFRLTHEAIAKSREVAA